LQGCYPQCHLACAAAPPRRARSRYRASVIERAWQSSYAVVFPTTGIGFRFRWPAPSTTGDLAAGVSGSLSSYRPLLPRSIFDTMFSFICFERPEEIPTPTRSFGRATLLGRVHWPRRLTKTTRCSNEFHWHVAACGSAAAAYLQGSRASIVRDYSVITRAEPRQALSWRKLTEVSMLRFRNEVRNCHDRSRGRAS
jgi:hypothetical protein